MATTTILPPWPHLLFAIIEPLTLIGGWALPFVNLPWFINEQTPRAVPTAIHPSAETLAHQLCNLYGLLFLLGVAICYTSSEPKVLRNYLVCLAIADAGHVFFTYRGMGWDAFADIGSWNALAWGNIGLTGFLFLNRIAYLLEFFGGPAPIQRGKVD